MSGVPEGWTVAPCRVFDDVLAERHRQLQKWGPQRHPDGTGHPVYARRRDFYREVCDARHHAGHGTWVDILLEEVYEALAESEREPLRNELIQCAAVIFSWIEDIDNRSGDRAVLASAA